MRAMPTFDLKRFFNQAAAQTARANLSPSFAEPLGTPDLLALEPDAAERLAALPLGYTTAFGGSELLDAVAARYDRLEPGQIVATCGGDDALSSLFMALLQPGDHVIVHSPVYQPLTSVATWCGAEVTLWAAEEEAGWEPPLDRLAHLLRATTRMIVVNFPHSPTGYVPDLAYLDRLVAIAEDAGCLLVGDEIYRGLPLDGAVEPPSLADLSARAVTLNSVSKTYGLPGLRVGWLATRNEDVRDAVRAFRMHLNTYLGAPVEFLAALAVRHSNRILAGNIALAQTNLSLLDAFLARHADRFVCVRPRGGVVAYPRWLGDETTGALSARLLRDHGLLLASSAHFAGGERHVRLGFGTAAFPTGLTLLEQSMQTSNAATD
ncbi:MAG: aminotransferase class I/II-fold pyridoxal phosphate-dependent enzyme [Thermomicrobiales bacterium]